MSVTLLTYELRLTRRRFPVDTTWQLFDSAAMDGSCESEKEFRRPKHLSRLSGISLDSNFPPDFVLATDILLSLGNHGFSRMTYIKIAY